VAKNPRFQKKRLKKKAFWKTRFFNDGVHVELSTSPDTDRKRAPRAAPAPPLNLARKKVLQVAANIIFCSIQGGCGGGPKNAMRYSGAEKVLHFRPVLTWRPEKPFFFGTQFFGHKNWAFSGAETAF
jgi:hypothetical protein